MAWTSCRGTTIRIAAPAAVLSVMFFVLPGGPTASGEGEESISLEESQRLTEEVEELLRDNRFVDAIGPLTRLYEAYPSNDQYIWSLAEAHRANGDYAAAAAMWDRFMDRSPMAWEACPTVGWDHFEAGQPEEAMASLHRCLDFDVNNTDYILALGLVHERLGHVDLAAELFARGETLAPGYLDFRVGKARLALRAGDAETARWLAADVLRQIPNDVDATMALAMAHSQLEQLEQARRYAEKVLQLTPHYGDVHLLLARIAESQGRLVDAERRYEDLLELEPDRPEPLAALRRLREVS